MSLNRRELLQGAGGVVAGTMLAGNESATAQTAKSGDFSIDTTFAEFMRNIGGTPHDGGGSVTFTGRDSIVRSRFRTGACMAVPAMGAGVGLLQSGESGQGNRKTSAWTFARPSIQWLHGHVSWSRSCARSTCCRAILCRARMDLAALAGAVWAGESRLGVVNLRVYLVERPLRDRGSVLGTEDRTHLQLSDRQPGSAGDDQHLPFQGCANKLHCEPARLFRNDPISGFRCRLVVPLAAGRGQWDVYQRGAERHERQPEPG